MMDGRKTTRSLRLAGEFLQQLRVGDASRLPADLARQVPYLLRHYPSSSEIEHRARLGNLPSALGPWLLPEDQDGAGDTSLKEARSDGRDDV